MTTENQTQTLMLGDVDIGQYVKKSDITDKRLIEVKAKIKELENNCLESEMNIYNELYSEMISREYPRIDLGFLEKSYVLKKTIEIEESVWFGKVKKEITLPVPAFSVYPFYGGNKFYIQIGNYDFQRNISALSRGIKEKLLKSFPVTKKGKEIRLWSEFNGLIPQRVKEKVKKSQEYFFENDIYIVAETKPEEWNVEQIKSDPLVIGLIANKNAHLIDQFNTTPLENLVKDNFLGDKLS